MGHSIGRRGMLWCTFLAAGAALAGRAAAGAIPGPGSDAAPRLVVLLIVDGLPQDQVTKYLDQLPQDGLRRLLDRGAWFTGAHHGHALTETAVGHATIVTGAHPYRHGIVGNEWFDRRGRIPAYAVEDPGSPLLEEGAAGRGGRSPRSLRVTAIGDELRLKTGFRAKVLSLSFKDRAAILAGGKAGAAYWYSPETGRFVTSTYYRGDYPEWWRRFHAAAPQDRWFGKAWEPLLPRGAYARSAPDDRPYHADFRGLGRKFPHVLTGGLARPGREYYEALAWTPMADELLAAFARAAVRGEGLGKNPAGAPDLLALSFSSHDYVNHGFGPESMQSHDHLLRLDRTIAGLLTFLDRWVGLANALVVLTADHGFSHPPEYCREVLGLDAGRMDPRRLREELDAHLGARFGPGRYVLDWRHSGVYLDDDLIEGKGVTRAEVEGWAAAFLAARPGVFAVFARSQLGPGRLPPTALARMVARAWDPERSGDLLVIPNPCWYVGPHRTGATHGSPWAHDSHVPLILMGPRWVRPGKYGQAVETVDVAPTLAHLLNLRAPAGGEGRALHEILRPAPASRRR